MKKKILIKSIKKKAKYYLNNFFTNKIRNISFISRKLACRLTGSSRQWSIWIE